MFRDPKIQAAMLVALNCVVAGSAQAHFILTKPDDWLMDADGLGGPQKGAPCGPGGYDDVGAPPTTGKVTTFNAGDEVSVEWTVTIPHSGFYRIAVAKDRSELKDPPLSFDSSCNFMTPDKTPPDYPVLIDNLDSGATSAKVKLPADLTCDKCTLQVIMWMTNHPPGCIYYHCADLKILPAGASTGTAGQGSAGTAAGASGVGGAAGSSVSTTGASGTGAAGKPAGTSGMTGTTTNPPLLMPVTTTTSGSAGRTTGGSTTVSAGAAGVTGGAAGAIGTPAAGPTTTTSKKSGCNVSQPGSAGASGLAICALACGILVVSARRRRSQQARSV